MTFTATLNGVKIVKELPTSWEQVSFRKYIELVEANNDPVKVLSVFVGVDPETLNKVKIAGLEEILNVISFVNVLPPSDLPKTILGHRISKDLAFETTGQFKDAQAIIDSMKLTPDQKSLDKDAQLKYLDLVAIFAMPNYLDSTVEEQNAFAQKFLDAPCPEVLAIGNFTLLKLIGWKLNIRPGSLNRIGRLKRWRLVIQVWVKSMVFSLRYAWLKRKLA